MVRARGGGPIGRPLLGAAGVRWQLVPVSWLLAWLVPLRLVSLVLVGGWERSGDPGRCFASC
jgi:hypothetical protein